MEFVAPIGVGVGDLQHAALSEARRVMKEAGGDRGVATGLVHDRLQQLGWITATERDVLGKMHAVGAATSEPHADHGRDRRPVATEAYFQVRRMYDELLAGGGASPVALALAAGVVGSYEPVAGGDGTTVVYAKSNRNYESVLAGVGAAVGGILGGAAGAGLGTVIGGAIGYVVDDCKD